jgi:hypothetical protein
MPDESLLSDDVRALIGAPLEMEPVRVTLRGVRRALDVYLGHHDGADYEVGDVVPGYVIAALDSESDPPPIPSLLPQSLLISNEWEFERPMRLGEEYSVTYRIVDISERFGGKFGYSLDFRSQVEFRDADGAVVARSARTMMQYDASQARDEGER